MISTGKGKPLRKIAPVPPIPGRTSVQPGTAAGTKDEQRSGIPGKQDKPRSSVSDSQQAESRPGVPGQVGEDGRSSLVPGKVQDLPRSTVSGKQDGPRKSLSGNEQDERRPSLPGKMAESARISLIPGKIQEHPQQAPPRSSISGSLEDDRRHSLPGKMEAKVRLSPTIGELHDTRHEERERRPSLAEKMEEQYRASFAPAKHNQARPSILPGKLGRLLGPEPRKTSFPGKVDDQAPRQVSVMSNPETGSDGQHYDIVGKRKCSSVLVLPTKLDEEEESLDLPVCASTGNLGCPFSRRPTFRRDDRRHSQAVPKLRNMQNIYKNYPRSKTPLTEEDFATLLVKDPLPVIPSGQKVNTKRRLVSKGIRE